MQTWSEAFAAQAASDLLAYEYLMASNLPVSHRLHYLQMWLEKLCKSYLWKPENQAEELRGRHNVVAKVLPRLISEHWRRIGFQDPPQMPEIRALCKEIDRLHPQVDDGENRPDNVEYPWRGRVGEVEVPAKWNFPLPAVCIRLREDCFLKPLTGSPGKRCFCGDFPRLNRHLR